MDRPSGSGGGLVLLIRNLFIKIVFPVQDSNLELQGISIVWKKKSIDIFNMYHSPNEAHLLVNFPELSNKSTIFLGDLNAKHLSWGYSSNNQKYRDLLEAADDKALIFLNDGSSMHISFSYGTFETSDMTLVSPELYPYCKWTVLNDIGSDHLPFVINIKGHKYYSEPCRNF
ncbi:hypothetical protein TNCV_4792631 [Trichonephila clavipes]|nr:hypothetical protein TNCV_4792631 [Trichonephila clavipes]